MPKIAPKISWSEEQIEYLKTIASSEQEEIANRAKIGLMAYEGMSNKDIAESLGITESTVAKRRRRLAEEGIEGLNDAAGKGRRPKLNEDIQLKISQILNDSPDLSRRAIQKIVEESCKKKVSHMAVQRVLDKTGLRKDPQESWAKNRELEFEQKTMILLGLTQHGGHGALLIGMSKGQIIPAEQESSKGFQQYDLKQSLLIAQLLSKDLNTKVSDKQQEAGNLIKDIEYTVMTNYDMNLYVILFAPENNRIVVKWLEKQEEYLEFHTTSSLETWLNLIEMQLKMLVRKDLTHNVLGSKFEVVRKIIKNIRETANERRSFGWWFNRGINN